jgi:hypothetical protein
MNLAKEVILCIQAASGILRCLLRVETVIGSLSHFSVMNDVSPEIIIKRIQEVLPMVFST